MQAQDLRHLLPYCRNFSEHCIEPEEVLTHLNHRSNHATPHAFLSCLFDDADGTSWLEVWTLQPICPFVIHTSPDTKSIAKLTVAFAGYMNWRYTSGHYTSNPATTRLARKQMTPAGIVAIAMLTEHAHLDRNSLQEKARAGPQNNHYIRATVFVYTHDAEQCTHKLM